MDGAAEYAFRLLRPRIGIHDAIWHLPGVELGIVVEIIIIEFVSHIISMSCECLI